MTAAAAPQMAHDSLRFTLPIEGRDEVAGRRWPNDGAPQLVFLHATGFCASAYAQMMSVARAHFDIFALDLRGHGGTTLPADPASLRSWDIYAEDLCAVLRQLPQPSRGRVLSGHSCGAVVAALAASRPGFDGAGLVSLALIEPVTTPRAMSLFAKTPFWPLIAARWPLVRGAKARRAEFPSRSAAAESYGRKPLFARWAEGALAAYLEDGLIDGSDSVRLACRPSWEAATFAAQAHDFWGAVRRAPAPIRILAADDPSSTVNPAARQRLRRRGADVSEIGGATHLVPFEHPDAAAAFLASAAPVA